MNNTGPSSGSTGQREPKRQSSSRRLLKVVAWCTGVVVLPILIGAIVLSVLASSARFHSYLLETLQRQASESLGVRVQLQNLALHPSTLSVDLYGITVDGAKPYPNPPLLQIRHVAVGVRIVSILPGKWYLSNFQVDRPVVQVLVDRNGVSNIPTLKSSGSSSNTSLFDLGIRHAVLDEGEIYYNNQPSELAVDLHDLELRASFNSLLKKYAGNLGYTDGRLVAGSLRPPPHNLDVQFDATPTTLHLTPVRLSFGNTQLALTATVNNYSAPAVDAQYNVTIDGSEVAKILRNPSVPTGLISATGSVEYQQAASRSVLESLILKGDMSCRELEARTAAAHARVENLVAHYALAHGNLTLEDFRANVLGGAVTANGTMKNIGGNSSSQVNAALREVSLSELRRMLDTSASAPGVAVAGVLNAGATATWGRTLDDLVAHADGTINGQVLGGQRAAIQVPGAPNATSGGEGAATNVIPVESVVHATYLGKSHQLALNKSYLRTAHTNLTMDGVVSNKASLAMQLEANDLREVEAIADVFRIATPGHPVQPIDLAGTASFHGTVQGSTSAPHLTGQLTASDLHFNGTAWKSLRTNVDVSPSLVSLQHADLQMESRGRITFNASAGLGKWSFTNTSPIQLELNASQINIADLTKLAGQQVPVTGTLNASIGIHGSELNPKGNGNITLTGVTAYGEPVSSARVDFSGVGDEARANLTVQTPAGSVQSKVSIRPGEKTYTAELSSSGIHLDKLQANKASNTEASGVIAINAKGQGTFDNPQLDAMIQIPELTIQKQVISGVKLQANVANHVVNATLASSAINTSIQAKAKVDLTGDYLADASLDTQGIPLGPLLAVYAPDQAANINGQTEVHATLRGPLKNKNLLEAHVTIPVLKMAYGNSVQLAAASPILVDYKNGTIDVQRSSIRGTDTDLQFQGSIPVGGNAPMSLLLDGTVNLQLAQLFDPDVRSSGELKFKINSLGEANGPDIAGEIDIVDANLASNDTPVGLQHGNGVLTLTKDRINIARFQGTVGGGTVSAQGGIAFRPAIQFNMGLAAQGIRILYPQGMRENLDANLRFTGTTDKAVLGGSVNLTDLSFTPAFDLASFIDQFSGGVTPPPSQGFTQNVALNLALLSSNNVNLVSRALSVNGSANLQVRGTLAEPVILGRANLNGGDIILNGNRFVLTGGTVQFVNPSETQPVVNLTLSTTIQQYNINLRFEGPVAQLRTQYSSDPALPSADIINLLAFGKTTEASANSPTTTNQAAESLVASQVSSQVTSRVSKIAGISQLSINPVLAGSSTQGPPGANITIQQRVTGNLFVTFSTNVASTQSQTIQGQYQVSPRVALSATRDPNGGFAVDALIKKTW